MRGAATWGVLGGCTLAALALARLDAVEFHPDESQWIATSRFFEALIAPPFGAALWNESYWTLTQPPLARYVIALGRRCGGFGPGDLNPPWDFSLSDGANVGRGARPAPRLLWWSRAGPALLGAAAAGVFAALVHAVGGGAAALACLALWAANPYLHRTLGRAMGESPLTLAVALAVLATAAVSRCLRSARHGGVAAPMVLGAALAAGIAAGAAAAAKLNGALAVVGSLAVTALDGPSGAIRPALRATATAAVPLAAVAVFVSINPALHANPGWGMVKMAGARGWEIGLQQQAFPGDAAGGVGGRLRRVTGELTTRCLAVTGPLGWLVNVPLVAAGLWRLWRAMPRVPEATALLALGLATALPAFFAPLTWERYYVLPAVFGTAAMAIGSAAALAALAGARRWTGRRR